MNMDLAKMLPMLLALAWLLPLASFVLIVLVGPRLGRAGRGAGFVATGAIVAAFLISLFALGLWLSQPPLAASPEPPAAHGHLPAHGPTTRAAPLSGDWYTLGEFGSLRITIGYYIDALTLAMFAMVTLIASCIHVYSFGYMHEELHEVTDPLTRLSGGRPLKRRGRFHRFYQYLSLFCFSMLGLVIAGNVAMVFVFWELVGICSYLLIGFYFERKSASNAGNKAFIVNRVGDFGMIVGLAALWATLGTFSFGDYKDARGAGLPGIFSQVRPGPDHALTVPDGMVRASAHREVGRIVERSDRFTRDPDWVNAIAIETPRWRTEGYGYGLLVVAGLGIFCGCVGKSAQFPLHVWLPDAMEGPTPVSALIHAATMVAAGVYLVGRFYPVFTPEVLLVIAYTGCITLFIAATIAITATDIKRVLAYSTVSQLGYMMLSLGVGGWLAGLFHLFTHAFFKSLLFLCSGSVIHACGTNEMPQMGGLRKKMPWTAYTMLAGCLAIAGAGLPALEIGLSGYYSKDAILAQVYSFRNVHPLHGGLLFVVAVLGAAITAFYMFRMWYMTFAGRPRSEHVYQHVHESPRTMIAPLVLLAGLAVIAGWTLPWTDLSLTALLEQARPAGTADGVSIAAAAIHMPAEHLSHAAAIHLPVAMVASVAALIGFVLATGFYGLGTLDPEDARRQFAPLYRLFKNKWHFDELYQWAFVRPAMRIAAWTAAADRRLIDGLADGLARWTVSLARVDDWIDRLFVDRLVDLAAQGTYAIGLWLRTFQTGKLRQYVMWIVVGMVGLFVVISFCRGLAAAGY
jgi:NADH:ubiquinone oxidoreductase subunit 5 (subunit L)/multisubunit Na+/H+ antiporter MnhA subunit